MRSWTEQHHYSCGLLFYISMGLWTPEEQGKAEANVTSLPFLPRGPTEKIHLKLLEAICNFRIATLMCMQAAQLCLKKESLKYLLNRAKCNHVFGKQACLRTEVSGRKQCSIAEDKQPCSCSTQTNSVNLSLRIPSVKVTLYAPDKSLSLCLHFPCVKGW